MIITAKQEELQRVAEHKEELLHFNRGIELATEIENYELLISAYTKNIVVFSRAGYYDYVAELFEKKAEAVAIEKILCVWFMPTTAWVIMPVLQKNIKRQRNILVAV